MGAKVEVLAQYRSRVAVVKCPRCEQEFAVSANHHSGKPCDHCGEVRVVYHFGFGVVREVA